MTRNGACRSTTIVALFEFIVLEGAQAGLSWDTILRKRDSYRDAFRELRSRARSRATTSDGSSAC